jgi:hypothetical protein
MNSDRLLKHGGRLRANEIAPKLKELGLEKGIIACLEALAVRDATLHEEVQTLSQSIQMLASAMTDLINHSEGMTAQVAKLSSLNSAIEGKHPDEGH